MITCDNCSTEIDVAKCKTTTWAYLDPAELERQGLEDIKLWVVCPNLECGQGNPVHRKDHEPHKYECSTIPGYFDCECGSWQRWDATNKKMMAGR